jgi:3-hydroxyisobutyrate dehydrogenase
VQDADIVVTMVPDAEAIKSFATGDDGFLPAMGSSAVWLQSSTVGVAPADELIAMAAQHAVAIVDAPVLGSREPAERGQLVVLASGEDDAISKCDPFFQTVSRRVLRLGPAGMGSRMKMVANHWIMGAVAALAETMALAAGLGVDANTFLGALEGTQMDMGYAQIKGRMMIARRYPPQGNLAIASKDARLAHAAAADLGLPARLSAAAADLMAAAVQLRGGGEDMAAAFEAALA